jgi:hypothetical protein
VLHVTPATVRIFGTETLAAGREDAAIVDLYFGDLKERDFEILTKNSMKKYSPYAYS